MSQHPQTRRELLALSAPHLRAIAADLNLPTTGRKTAVADRICRHRRDVAHQAQQQSPQRSPRRSRSPPAPPTSDRTPSRTQRQDNLERTVQRLVESSLQGMEERLLSSLRPLVPATAAATDNISLPSPLAQRQPPHAPVEGTSPTAQGLTAATSTPTAPLTQPPPLPDKVRQKIVRGEYIDLDTLLPESLYPARHGLSPSPSFTLRLSSDSSSADGDVVIAQQKPAAKRTIRDLPSWMEAWNVYIQVVVQQHPARALSMLAYQSIICAASISFPPRCWLRYDQRFRACAAADTTIRWDRKHNDLWLECFTQPLAQPPAQPPAQPQSATAGGKTRRPCTYCGSLYHFPDNCPTNPFRPSRASPAPLRPSTRTTPTSATQPSFTGTNMQPPLTGPNTQPLPHHCRDFNKGNCQRRSCRFRHACTKCDSPSHGERDCPTSH